MKKVIKKMLTVALAFALVALLAVPAYAARRTFDTSVTTIQDLAPYITVDNNKDGTITVHMPKLSNATVVIETWIEPGPQSYSLHYGYHKTTSSNFSFIGCNFMQHVTWNEHTPFTDSDITIDITTGEPRTALLVPGHLSSKACTAPHDEVFWGLYGYTNPVKVTYNLNGGSVKSSTDDRIEYLLKGEKLQTTFAKPKMEGFAFDGWYTQPDGGEKVTESTANPGKPVTYYAHWVIPQDVPETGDNNAVAAYMVLLAASAAALMLIYKKRTAG